MVTRAKNGANRDTTEYVVRAGAKIELLPEGSESQGLPNLACDRDQYGIVEKDDASAPHTMRGEKMGDWGWKKERGC